MNIEQTIRYLDGTDTFRDDMDCIDVTMVLVGAGYDEHDDRFIVDLEAVDHYGRRRMLRKLSCRLSTVSRYGLETTLESMCASLEDAAGVDAHAAAAAVESVATHIKTVVDSYLDYYPGVVPLLVD